MRPQFQCNACKGVYYETMPDGVVYVHACGPLPATAKDPERERPDKRDENPVYDSDRYWIGIRSEGAGVRCITDARLEEPRWISALKKQRDAREEKEDA
jgi:hypothetical protein